MEMNLSETAFLAKLGDAYHLRWFTPETEVNLCGHATLSSAHILYETGLEKAPSAITFNTLSGKLTARKLGSKIELDFPAYNVKKTTDNPNINEALGVKPIFTAKSNNSYFIEIADPAILKGLKPDFTKLKELGQTAFIVTCKSDDPSFDFYSRFFAPAMGINEDPVTGSSHTALIPYWSQKLGKTKLMAYQASKRSGILECELAPNGRVLIRGKAVMVFEIDMKLEL
jgi:PhzF family phenazine biosynthesis protein